MTTYPLTKLTKHVVSKFNSVKLSTLVKYMVLIIPILLYSCSTSSSQTPEKQTAVAVPVLTIPTGTQAIETEYPASIEATANIEVRPQVAGILEQLFVDEGAKVSKGQLLFKIDSRPYREQLNQAKANLLAAEAALENAELEVEKKTRLVENKVLTDFQLKSALSARNIARSNVEMAKSAVESAKINLDYTSVRAATSGYIGRLQRKQGSLVSPSDQQPLTTLSDVHDLHVYFSLGEKDFVSFTNESAGKSMEEKLKLLPAVSLILADERVYEHPGKIDMVDGQFDKNTGAISIRATFPNPQGTLRNGNTGRIRMEKSYQNAVLVPQAATVEIQDKVFVFSVSKDNSVSQQSLAIIGKQGSNYLVAGGLQPGAKIVSKRMDLLKDGQKITPQEETSTN
ncbi:efflux RND transporter periplasmic adaptor subunit [Sphingobacterium oryzagri]|uniref:Efflux RND transporter periplasmic adaptor subunit n=1 Tax=Sphingobacterium oryzagri TaxID=3025669 RepID=A0ABY7WSM5_9SPHI|nr:efflux RND transporter periplasmic adaptor subunit [Sphingobacterium sp. KACC 22765]WDF70304.1 efflux RND transporter periplasmic adaptor subunit [Sphingobacterium sp. KACC 22765]